MSRTLNPPPSLSSSSSSSSSSSLLFSLTRPNSTHRYSSFPTSTISRGYWLKMSVQASIYSLNLRLRTSPTIPFGVKKTSQSNAIAITMNNTEAKRWSLGGMTALVTGGTRGIGRAIVEELLGLGARVYTCSRNADELDACLRDWRDLGFEVSGSVCDVSRRSQREDLMEAVSSVFDGKLNILVNNAGTNIRKPMVEFTAEEFSTLMATNFESVFHLCQLAYPLLKTSGKGSVVFMSSVSSFVSLKSMSVQGATKGAINQLTRNLACEWANDNIRVNSVAPWYIRTSMVEQV